MSQSDSSIPAIGLARVLRLARKELRESLRDRRTIITLVVMPLLVYPILSLAFRVFLLSSFQQSGQVHLRIATTNQDELRALMILMAQGDQLLKERESSAAGSQVSGGSHLGTDSNVAEPPFDPEDFFAIRDDIPKSLEDLVRSNDIDLGVRLLTSEGERPPPWQSRFQLIYRSNTPMSRQAASFVERRLRAVNDNDLEKRLAAAGDSSGQRAVWRLRPVADEQGDSFWLGTLVPLVLILMTITGAVYPAIDLTAGERERGTLESLMAAPVPRLAVLMAKYIAVVTVAMLTAVINLTAMTVTIASSGLSPILFGDHGLALTSILAVLVLLVLFAAFFSAVLLLITSFARSFKEAQAYLIPLMVVSLAPGFMSVMPGLELNSVLSVIPLANIVLLTRDVLEGDAPLIWGAIAVLSTILYGGVALAMAARVFGSDAILYGSEGSWGDLLRQPRAPQHQATIPGALTALAVIAPLYVVLSGLLAQLQRISLTAQLLAAAGISLILFIVVPIVLARLQGVRLKDGFQLHHTGPLTIAAAVILGCTLWPLAYDSIILCQHLGIATISVEKLAEHRPALLEYVDKLRAVAPGIVLFALAVCPAIGEELFFRGYLLGALRGRLPAWAAILLTGIVFGLFHATVGGLIAVERIISSTFLGLVLGWICWRTLSVFPGMLVHVLHNGLMLGLVFFAPQFQAWGWDTAGQRYLPLPLTLAATALVALALALAAWFGRGSAAVSTTSTDTNGLPSNQRPTGRQEVAPAVRSGSV